MPKFQSDAAGATADASRRASNQQSTAALGANRLSRQEDKVTKSSFLNETRESFANRKVVGDLFVPPSGGGPLGPVLLAQPEPQREYPADSEAVEGFWNPPSQGGVENVLQHR